LNNDFVGEHPETVKDQGNFYTLLCRKQIRHEINWRRMVWHVSRRWAIITSSMW